MVNGQLILHCSHRLSNHVGKKSVVNGSSEGKMEETNVNFTEKMYGNWWIYSVVHQNMCRRYITVRQTQEYKKKWICFDRETAFSEPNNRLFTKRVPTDVMFIEGKVNYLLQKRKILIKGAQKCSTLNQKALTHLIQWKYLSSYIAVVQVNVLHVQNRNTSFLQ